MDNLQTKINNLKAALVEAVNSSGLPGSVCELIFENVLNQIKMLNYSQETKTEKEGDEA